MKRLVLTLAALALAGPACAETLGEKTGVNSALGIAPTTQDFVHEAAISDMFEIQSSKLAEQRTSGPTKSFAQRMIADHTKTSSELKSLAQKAKVEVPTRLDAAHQKMLDKLQSLQGKDFASRYHSDQDSGHKEAVALFERYAKGGEDAQLKQFAQTTLPTLKEHRGMAENLDK